MFKATRIQQNGVDQPTAGLYAIIKPKRDSPYWQLLYDNPKRTIYLQGNVKIIMEEKDSNKTATIITR